MQLQAGHGHGHSDTPVKSALVKFVENKAQWEEQIRYAADLPGGRVFFENNQLTYTFADLSNLHDDYFHGTKSRRENAVHIKGHAFRMKFVGGNPQPEIAAEGQHPEYNNYYIGNDPAKWASKVGLFGELQYREMYAETDVIFHGLHASLKYDIVVHPGGNTQDIVLEYEGLKDIYIDAEGNLVLVTSLGEIKELAPYAFQEIAGRTQKVPCHFRLEENRVTFEFPAGYDAEKDLVIDPNLIFGSYTGSMADNFGYTATYDTAGNLYGGGIVFGAGYPTSMGAFQTTFQGGTAGNPFPTGFDIGITKFNPTGTTVVWSTYLGGTLDNEQPQSLITTENGDLYIYGRTFSTDYPTTPGAYQTVLAGGSDIVVTKFNASGSLARSTFVGGTSNDGLNIHTTFFQSSLYFNYGDDARGEVMLDAAANVYIASCTQSNNFPVTTGALQGMYGGGAQDGCVFRMDSSLANMAWATFLGGSGDDAAYSVKVDASQNAFVAGGTSSADFNTTGGVVQPLALGGTADGFISQINPTGTALVASTYIGTTDYDQCFFLELDAARNVYVVGQTLGAFPVTPGVYSNAGGKQFIARYDAALTTTQLSTVFGNGNSTIDISPTAFLVDRCGFIYVSGWGGTVNFQGTTTGLPTTSGPNNTAFQSTTDGSDVYLMVLEPDAQGLEYASFYGGATSAEHVDGGTSRFDKELIIYQAVCAGCGGNSDFPTTIGSVSQTNNSTNCNLGVFKFAFEPQDVLAAYLAVTLDSCAPFPVNFTNNSVGGVSYVWDFGDNTPPVTTFNASHVYQNAGTYTVTLVAIDSNSCNFSDTARQTVTVFANPLAVAGGSDTVCAGGSVQLTSGGGQFYDWQPAAFLTNNTIANPIANPPVNTTFSVIVSDTNGCVDTAYVDVFVTNFSADAGPPTSFCEGTGGAQLQAGLVGGGTAPYWYTWWCDSTNTFCGLDSTYDDDPIANPSQTTTYYLQVTDSRGCLSEIDSTIVEILPVPIADAGADQYICQPPAPGAILQGSFSNAPGPFTYYWMPGTGLNDSTLLTPFARPDTTTIYTLVGTSANGCTSAPTTLDTLSTVTVHVNPRPIADAGPDIDICLGDTTTLQGVGFGAGPDYKYEWSPSVGLSDSAIANPLASPPFTHIYTLVTWSNGCPSIGDSMTLWVHTLPTPSAGNIVEICLGDSAQLDAFGAGDSSAYYTYQWWPSAAMNDSTLENPKASPDTSTWYYLVATSSWGCDSPVDSVLVRVKPTPQAEAGDNLEICGGDTTTLLGSYYYTSTDSADPSQIYYNWSPSGTISDPTLAQPQAWPGGSQVYYLDVTHNTCTTRDSVLVTYFPEIGAWVDADTTTICGGDSVQLYSGGGLGGVQFNWIPSTGLDDPTSANPLAAPADSTTYQVVMLEGGCLDTVAIQINVIPRPEMAYLSSDPAGCPPHTVSFLDDSQGPIQFIWDFGDGSPVWNGMHPTHTYSTPGSYQVSLTGVNLGGCAATVDDIMVTVHDTALADFVTDPEFPADLALPAAGVQFTDRSQNASSWRWDFGDGIFSEERSPFHTFTEVGEYFPELTIWSPQGCESKVVHGPFVISAPDLFIPNVFSPNDDNINDVFLVEYTGSQPFVLRIFDRWGVQHFETKNKYSPWRGLTEAGDPVPEGVYYYQVNIGDKRYAGDVTLVR